jgi:hypothetical protein
MNMASKKELKTRKTITVLHFSRRKQEVIFKFLFLRKVNEAISIEKERRQIRKYFILQVKLKL